MSSSSAPEGTESHQTLLLKALEEYHSAIEGDDFDVEQFISQFPPISGQLRRCLTTLSSLREIVPNDDASTDSPLLPNLGEFEIVRELGRGGMGIVYEARERQLDRLVALKVLPFAALLDERQMKRFRAEARAAAMLKHPHIVHIYSVGSERSVHYYAMELIDGMSLAELIQRRRVQEPSSVSPKARVSDDTTTLDRLSTSFSTGKHSAWKRIARLGVNVAEALDYAHGEGVIHRDIKPSNLLLDAEGKIHIADFGLAHTQTKDDLTLTGDIVGTMRYMSPEQLLGKPVDARSDVYSLGLTLYELICSRPAFDGGNRVELSRQVIEAEPQLLRKHVPGIPSDLENIVHKAIARNADARYSSATELAEDLRCFIEQKPVRARPVGAMELTWRWCKRNKAKAGLLALSACVLLALAVLGPLYAQQQTGLLRQQRELAEDRRRDLYAAHMKEAHAALQRGDHGHVNVLLEKYVPQEGGPEDLRGFEWRWMRSQSARQRKAPVLFQGGLAILSMARSPNGKQIAFGTYFGGLHCLDPRTGDAIWVSPRWGKEWQSIQFTPDGKYVIAGGFVGQLDVVHASTGIPVAERLVLPAPINKVAVSQQKIVAVGLGRSYLANQPEQETKKLKLYRMADEDGSTALKAIADFEVGAEGVKGLAFSADGSVLAMAGEKRHVRRWRMSDLTEFAPLVVGDRFVTAIAFAPESNHLAVCSSTGDRLVDAKLDLYEHDSLRWSMSLSEDSPIVDVVFSPDEQVIACCARAGRISVHQTEEGEIVDQFVAHTPIALATAFGATSKDLLSGGGDETVRKWELADSAQRDSTLGGSLALLAIGFSSDSRSVLVAGARGIAHRIDCRTGAVITSSPNLGAHIVSIAASPVENLVALGLEDGRLELRSADFVHVKKTLRGAGPGRDNYVSDLHFSADGKQLLAAANRMSRDPGVSLWDVGSGRLLKQLEQNPPPTRGYWRCAYSRDQRYIAGAAFNGGIVVWDAASHEQTALLTKPDGHYALAFLPTERRLFVGSGTGTIRAWDFLKGEDFEFGRHATGITDMNVSPDGKRLVTVGTDGTVRIWDTSSGRELMSNLTRRWAWRARFSPDGSMLAVCMAGPDQQDKLLFWRIPQHVGLPYASLSQPP